ncbi:MAG TPA: DPP IV N-terminal domain-containing protein [Rhodanobacteraceae bacterium]
MPVKTRGALRLAGGLLGLCCPLLALAATGQVTRADYVRAQSFMYGHVAPLIDHAVRRVTWLDATHVWYVETDAGGHHYKVMDAVTGKVQTASDRVAQPHAEGLPRSATVPANGALSPNGRYVAYVHDWNLWLRDLATGKDIQLTFDGVKNDGYATQDAGWIHSANGAIVRWSPDSKKIATYRQDQRRVGDMFTITTRVGHPRLERWKGALVGDKHVFMIQPLVIDVVTKKIVKLKMAPEQRLSTLCDTLACGDNEREAYKWSDVKWAPDSKTFAFVTTSRNRQHEWFRIANAQTGAVHTGFHFTARSYYESGHGTVNWQYLPRTDQAIWSTVQNNWMNLYLYSLKTGKQIRAITIGRGNVDEVLRFDRADHTLWFVGNARTAGINPYFKQFFKVNIDTGKTTLLTPEAADHDVSLSPNGRYFVDSYSTVDQPPVTVLRSSADGHVIATIARTNISRLKAAGWVPPTVIKVKARDGKTTLYGLMFKPTNFDPHKHYPLIDYIYPGPQVGSVSNFGFAPARIDHQAMAELGFIVIAINGMGTPWRSASFHHLWYGNAADNTLPDQVTAIKQLARRDPWIDLSRVGIWGHSGGGNATVAAMFLHPDFFKVGWAESGNYDFRNYENDWGEKYQGLLVTHKNGTTNYDSQALWRFAKNLKGPLMLVHGSTDPNVPVGETYLVINALIRANKNFHMLIVPNAHHFYGAANSYVVRRRWDFFVRYLLGATPPQGFRLHF